MIIQRVLKDKVKLVGFVTGERKVEFIKNALFIVMPSRFEGLSLVTLEVVSLGKALVVNNIPELKYVTENDFGISFRSEDVKELKQTMEYLIKNKSLLLEMGQRGRQYARQFTWDKISEDFESYLKEILPF